MLDGAIGFELTDGPVPLVHGPARLAGMLFAGSSGGDLLDLIGPQPTEAGCRAAWLMDRSWACALTFSPYQAGILQEEALALRQVFRVRGACTGLRLLALAAPGDLTVNIPLDFITGPAGVRLDWAFLAKGGILPPALPEHDVAIVAASESAPAALAAYARVFGLWPRPILNDPAQVLPMTRTGLPERLRGLSGVACAPARLVGRAELALADPAALLPGGTFPLLLRPLGSHGGHGLVRADHPGDVARFLAATPGDSFVATAFVDYRGANGWYCKYRVALVGGQPFVCHMAASDGWMVHYLNAGMDTDPTRRAAEEAAMRGGDGFLQRHRDGLAAVAEVVGLDYFSIDCAEKDGALLVFEADTAAIIHAMDPPALFPYKRPAMQRCFDSFGAMLEEHAARG